MTRSGYLPNITEEFNFYKRESLAALARHDYPRATSSLKALNTCLGEDYMIDINDDLYKEQLALTSTYQCEFCTTSEIKIVNKGDEDEREKTIQVPTQIPIKGLRIYKITLNDAQSFLLNSKVKECWLCPKCHQENDMRTTVKISPTRGEIDFIKVVPSAPIRGIGLASRNGFDIKYNEWFNNFMEEIVNAMVLYRTEWKAQNDGDEMIGGYIDKGDDS